MIIIFIEKRNSKSIIVLIYYKLTARFNGNKTINNDHYTKNLAWKKGGRGREIFWKTCALFNYSIYSPLNNNWTLGSNRHIPTLCFMLVWCFNRHPKILSCCLVHQLVGLYKNGLQNHSTSILEIIIYYFFSFFTNSLYLSLSEIKDFNFIYINLKRFHFPLPLCLPQCVCNGLFYLQINNSFWIK